MPYVCGFAIFGAFFLIASLGPEAVWRFFIVLIVISFLYLVYGVHAAESHDNDLDLAHTCANPSPYFDVPAHMGWLRCQGGGDPT